MFFNDKFVDENAKESFKVTPLFENATFEIFKGEKVALIGENGTGKTTLIRIILNETQKKSGRVTFGSQVQTVYYDQEHQNIDVTKTIFQEISDTYPRLTVLEIRNALASFVFSGDDVFKLIGTLSGGERGRVALAKLMLSNANFLILDEPTNHLDIFSKEILERALKSYQGTVLYISHDRYFINNTATKIIELTPKTTIIYDGNYDYFVEKQVQFNLQNATAKVETVEVSEKKDDRAKKKEEELQKRKQATLITKTEKEIHKIENEIKELEVQLELPEINTNAETLQTIFKEKLALENRLEALFETWEGLQG